VYPSGVDRVVGVVVCGRRIGDRVSESRDASLDSSLSCRHIVQIEIHGTSTFAHIFLIYITY
jgi:hypothetical protein